MSLEVKIGADKSEFDKKIKEIEFDIKELSKEKSIQIKAGLDTTEITKNIKDAKKSLSDLKTTLKDTGNSFSAAAPKIANAGNTLTQFSRIAQDAPFGIMGIGNNITATVESFNHLKQSTGSAGGALKAMASSLMGSGGILLGVSLLTTGLTIMAQQGLTVSDVFNKLTGNFDEFKKSLTEVNAEAAKTAGSEASIMKGYAAAASNVSLSMSDRLAAVKKLQDEYPAYFGNLSKEQILNGNVASAIKAATAALIAKAKAQGFAGKVAELAAKEVPLREKEAAATEAVRKATNKLNEAYSRVQKFSSNESFANAWARAGRELESAKDDLADIKAELSDITKESGKWQAEVNKNVAIEIPVVIKPEKVKKALVKAIKKPKATFDPHKEGLMAEEAAAAKSLISKDQMGSELPFIVPAADEQFQAMLESMRAFNQAANDIITGSIADTFGQLGTSIGEALATGGNVLMSIGTSILQGMSKFLSDMGGLLIKYGTLAVVKGKLDLAILAGGPLAIGAGLAAIGVGVALKAAGGALGSMSTKTGGGKTNVSAGNSVSSPTSSINNSSNGGGFQNVVFEISGQSLVGVLSNTLNRNVKLGGTPAI